MARLPRLDVPGVAQHVIQRGNNREVCFASEEDFVAYAGWLHEYSIKHLVEIHAWVFMTNHVHLLVTPKEAGGVSKLMQSLGRRYVPYFNHQYKRSGTLWEGRFKSCLVQSEQYLMECYRYIELNPVRASMVEGPGDYKWSSYHSNGLGVKSKLITAHQEYLSLGRTEPDRLANYRSFFVGQVRPDVMRKIRESTQKGLVIGSDRFAEKIEALSKRRALPAKLGRPFG
jgi:putative transposase